MNAVDMAKMAYGSNGGPVRTSRGTEYALFARITHRIKSAEALGSKGFGAMARALHDNRRLWSILAIDVADKENSLPQTLRAQIFYLAEFVDLHSRKVLKGQAKADVLVEVNTAIMRGLGAQGQQP